MSDRLPKIKRKKKPPPAPQDDGYQRLLPCMDVPWLDAAQTAAEAFPVLPPTERTDREPLSR